MAPFTFLFMGRSGCGKGTQSKLLSNHLIALDGSPVYQLEGGFEFRKFFDSEGYSPALSRALNGKGELQPVFLSVAIWSRLLLEKLKGDEHLIVDGPGRRYLECEVLDTAFDFYSRTKPFVIHLNVSPEWSRTRMLARGRADDTTDAVERRLSWFKSETLPAMDFYRNNPKYTFIEINGEQSIEAVHEELVAAIAPYLPNVAN